MSAAVAGVSQASAAPRGRTRAGLGAPALLRARVVRGAVAALLGVGACALAVAAPKVEDTMAQRVLACTGCHGPQGRAASDGYYPRIAGKPAGYLYNQLLSFRDGRRHYTLMANLLAPLDDAYLHEIAAHFSSLELPYPPPRPADSNDTGAARRGEALVTQGDAALHVPACTRCHGSVLMGVAPGVPALLGLPRDYLNAQLGAWRTGSRRAMAPDCMADVAKALAPADIAALSLWLSSRPVPPGAKPAAGLPEPPPARCGGLGAEAAK